MTWWLIPYLFLNLLLIVWVLRMIVRIHRFLIKKEEGYLPYVRTSARGARTVLQTGALHGVHKVVDLGCGTGVFLKEVQRQHPKAELVGVEHSAVLVWIARSRFFMRRLAGYSKVQIVRGDMFEFDITSFDGVVGFWVTELMPPLLEKFEKESPKGVRILSHIFQFPQNSTFNKKQLGNKSRRFFLYTRS